MSHRNLTHFFSPNSVKPLLSPESDTNGQDCMTPVIEKARKKTKQSIVKSAHSPQDEDFENEPLMPSQNGNSITNYFSPVDRSSQASKKKKYQKPAIMTVEAQVHGSPTKQKGHIILKFKKVTKKAKKKKTGIPESLANKIEVLSSEEVAPPVSQPEVSATAAVVNMSANTVNICKENGLPKQKWQLKLCFNSSVNSSDGDFEGSQDVKEGPRRSTRLRNKPPSTSTEPVVDESQKVAKKKRKKDEKCGDDEDVEILSEDVAPIFFKKKLQEEARAVKKAKQDFLFSGVPEVLKQQASTQQKLEQRPVEVFPKISHVTQAGSRPWNLPFPDKCLLLLAPSSEICQKEPVQPRAFSSCLSLLRSACEQPSQKKTSIQIPFLEWRDCKLIICKMKEDLSITFPFFRTLRNLLPKSAQENHQNMLWTDAYAPKSSADFLQTNRKPANQLKMWLNQWKLKAGEEVAPSPKKPRRKTGKRKRISSDGSELDDEVAVEERSNSSWCSDDRLNTCVLLVGPSGCGKTATVYALAEELGFHVLEVNASSKRNGKTVLSQLHEATQSHSLNSTTPTSNTLKNFFTGVKSSAPKPQKPEERRAALSLALFKDVDIVFEAEDESFYGALTTLIQTSKRPIVMTLGTTQERALTLVQDKIKSFFDVILFTSPEIPTTCGYLWSLSLAKGYPLKWESLQCWVADRTKMDVDLRSLILQLQFLLQHHPLGLKLNFTQLQLKGEEESLPAQEAKLPNAETSNSVTGPVVPPRAGAGQLVLIDLPASESFEELPLPNFTKLKKFIYNSTEDIVELAKPARYHRILDPDSQSESDQNENTEEGKQSTPGETPKWQGDLWPLVQLLELKASKDLLSSMQDSEELSWNEKSILGEMEEFSAKKCCKLLEKEVESVTFETDESRALRQQNDESLRSANRIILNSSISRTLILQRRASDCDILPYLRSFLRSDVVRIAGKRRRKGNSQSGSSIRLPSLDLVLSTPTVLELANQF